MKSFFLISFLAAVFMSGVTDIATINRLKKEAAQAYQDGNFQQAITNYQILVDSFHVGDEHVKLNLANAYFQSQDTTAAYNYYRQLLSSENRQVKSAAYQQMGIIDDQKKNQKQALAYFKESLKANPANEDARYNYELLKKTLKDQEQNQDQQQNKEDQEKKDQEQNKDKQNQDQQNQQNQDQENQDQQQKDQQQQDQESEQDQQQNQDQKDQEQAEEQKENQEAQQNDQQKGEQEQSDDQQENEEQPANPTTAERLKEMNMSEEKARMILEAMRNNEQQYIQQIKRKAQKPVDRGKPDW